MIDYGEKMIIFGNKLLGIFWGRGDHITDIS